jgi:hypothetical protein
MMTIMPPLMMRLTDNETTAFSSSFPTKIPFYGIPDATGTEDEDEVTDAEEAYRRCGSYTSENHKIF